MAAVCAVPAIADAGSEIEGPLLVAFAPGSSLQERESTMTNDELRADAVKPGATDDRLPDRLAVDPKSPFHDAAVLERGVGIRLNGVEKTTIEEYCISEGWVRMAVGKARDRHGRPILLKFKGEVVAYFLDAAPASP